MAKMVRVSLANKCQLLFGAAVILIIGAALAVAWWRMEDLVANGQRHTAQQIAQSHRRAMVILADASSENRVDRKYFNKTELTIVKRAGFREAGEDDPFIASFVSYIQRRLSHREMAELRMDEQQPVYLYATVLRNKRITAIRQAVAQDTEEVMQSAGDIDFGTDIPSDNDLLLGYPQPAGSALEAIREADRDPEAVGMIMIVRLPAIEAQKQLVINRIYLVGAGLLAGLLAIAVFWYITTRLILSPVRVLRNYAEQVSKGDLNTRSDIATGDEFEQLSDMFNTMLENLNRQADQLKGTNKSLDLKLGELAETNVALYEANKVKGEFLANVSHELRTPLNSIVGFAEVLRDTLPDLEDKKTRKRARYLGNIIESSRQLLDLINDLLDLAKIEAGRMEIRVAPMPVRDSLEGLINLIRPQAEKRAIDLRVKAPPNLPIPQTDPGKVQQILFNFLSNAIKFTPDDGTITMSASLEDADGNPQENGVSNHASFIRIDVIDTGPGIAKEDQKRIFEKFTQLDQSVTREHSGTGLGLTISRDLARLLRGRVEVASVLGEGATFSLLIPLDVERTPEAFDLRPPSGSLAG